MGYFILSKCYPDNLLFQIRIRMTPIQQLQVFSCSFQGSAFFEEAQISSPKSLRKSLRESKACLEFLAKIPLQSLVRERASDGKVAWLSLGGGVFLGSLCESVSLLCIQKFVCTSGCYDSLCLLHEVTCSRELFGGAVDSLVTSEMAQTQQRKQGTVRNSRRALFHLRVI